MTEPTHPWNDPTLKISAATYCRWIFDDIFPKLAECLNEVHGENHNERYWKIIVGPWFFRYIESRYEQYVDPKNEFKTLEPTWMVVRPNGLITSLKNSYARILDWVGKTRPIILCDLNMSHLDVWKICAATRFRAWPMIRQYVKTENLRSKINTRISLRKSSFDWGKDEFSNILLEGLAEVVPDIFIEKYAAICDRCGPLSNPKRKMFISGSGWKSNERLKFIAARASENGAKVISVQHGGNTGWNTCLGMEDFVRDYVDDFITWGISSTLKIATPLPNPRLNKLIKGKQHYCTMSGEGLFIGTSFPRYVSAGIRTQPMSGQVMDYMEWQNRFFKEAGDCASKFLVRTYPADYGWKNKIRLLQDFPGLDMDIFSKGVIWLMKAARLVVIDNPQTTFLEAMCMDKPCILYFDTELWRMNSEAAKKFKELEAVGIAHFSPESAAKKVKEVHANPWEWWNSEDVKSAKKNFLDWCVSEDPNWAKAWAMTMEKGLVP